MFNRDDVYTRKLVEWTIDPERKKGISSSSYYAIEKNGLRCEKIAFINYGQSKYINEYVNEASIRWQDSFGRSHERGSKFLNWIYPIYFFIKINNNGEYRFIGEVKSFRQESFEMFSNTFIVIFKDEMHEKVIDLLKKSKNYQFSFNQSLADSHNINWKEIERIGRIGEEIFNDHLKNKKILYKSILESMKQKFIIKNLENKFSFKWNNKTGEKNLAYDFTIFNHKLDVKTSKINLKRFFISSAQHELIKNNDLIIMQILIDKNDCYKDHEILDSNFLLENFNFTPWEYRVDLKKQ